jgi:hypothetical protein
VTLPAPPPLPLLPSWSGPLEAFAIIGLLLSLVGTSALPALGLLLIIVPVQFYIGTIVTKIRGKLVK